MKNVLPKVAISNKFTKGCLESFKFAKKNLAQRLRSLSLQFSTTQNKIALLLPGGGFMPGLYPLCQHIKKQNPHINTINVSLVDPNELVTVANIKSIYVSAIANQLFPGVKSIAMSQDKAVIIFELNSFEIIIKVANMRLDTYKQKHPNTKFDVIMIENPMIQPWPLVSLGCSSSLKPLIKLRDSLGELKGFSKKNKTWILLTTHFIPELIQGIALLSTKYNLSDRNIKRIYSSVVPYHTSESLPYHYNLFSGKYRGMKTNTLCQRKSHDVCLTFSMCSTLLLMILSHAQGNQHNLPLYVSPLLFMGYTPPNLKGSIFALGLVMLQLAACLYSASIHQDSKNINFTPQ